jgi:hypothetical protein
MKRSKVGRKNEKGIALIFSLVMVGLLLVLAMGFVASSIFDQRASMNAANSIVARGLAQSTVTRVLAMMEVYGNVTAYSRVADGSKDFLSSLSTDGIFTYNPETNTDITWEMVRSQDPNDQRILGRVAYIAVPNRLNNDGDYIVSLEGIGLDPAACVKPGVDEGEFAEERIGASMDEINLRSLNPDVITADVARKLSYTDVGGVLPLPAMGAWIDFVTLFSRIGTVTDAQKAVLKSNLMIDPPATKELFAIDTNNDKEGNEQKELFNRFQLNKAQSEWDSMTVDKLLRGPIKTGEDNPNSGGLAWLRYWGAKWDLDNKSFVYDEFLKGTFDLVADRRDQIVANLIDYNDSDSVPTSDIDPDEWSDISKDGPSYSGNEKTPYLNEVGCYIQAMVENDVDNNAVNVHVDGYVAPELVNLYGSTFGRNTAVKVWGSYEYTVRFKERQSQGSDDDGDILPPGEEDQPDGEDHPLYNYPKYTFWSIDDEHAKLYYYVMNEDDAQVKTEGTITGLVSSSGGQSDIESMKINDNGYIYFIDRDRNSTAKLYRIAPDCFDKDAGTAVPATYIGDTHVASGSSAVPTNMEFLADGRVIFIGHHDGRVYTLDIATAKVALLTKLYYHGSRWSHTVDGLAQASDGTIYFTHTGRYYDNRHRYRSNYETELFKITDLENGTIEKVMNIHGSGKVEAIATHPDGNIYCADDFKWYRVNPAAQTTEVITEFSADIEGMDFHWPSEVIKNNGNLDYATNKLAQFGCFAGGDLDVNGSIWLEGNCHANGYMAFDGSHQWGQGSETMTLSSCHSISGRGWMAGGAGWNRVSIEAPSVNATPWGDFVKIDRKTVPPVTIPDLNMSEFKATAEANNQVRSGGVYRNVNWSNVPGGVIWFDGDVTLKNTRRHHVPLNCIVIATGNITLDGDFDQWDASSTTCGIISTEGSISINGGFKGQGLCFAHKNISINGSVHCLKGQFIAGCHFSIGGSLRIDGVDNCGLGFCFRHRHHGGGTSGGDENGDDNDGSGETQLPPEPVWQTVTVSGNFVKTIDMSNSVTGWNNGYKMSWSNASASFIASDDKITTFQTHDGYELGQAEITNVRVSVNRAVVKYAGKNVDIAMFDADVLEADTLSADLAAVDFDADSVCTGEDDCQCAMHRYRHRHQNGFGFGFDFDVNFGMKCNFDMSICGGSSHSGGMSGGMSGGNGHCGFSLGAGNGFNGGIYGHFNCFADCFGARCQLRHRHRHRQGHGASCSAATLMQLTEPEESWKKFYLAGSISAVDPRQNLNKSDWLVKSIVVADGISDSPIMNGIKAYQLAGGSVAAANSTADTSSIYKSKFSPYKSYLADPGAVDFEKDVDDPINVSTNRIRNAAMQSPWELGFIHRGAAWQTINLKSFDSNHAVSFKDGSTIGIYANGDANILDQIKMTDAITSPYKVDLKIANTAILTALLDRIKVNTTGLDLAGANSGDLITDLNDVATAIRANQDITTRASVVNLTLNDKKAFTGSLMAQQTNDAAQEEIIGKFINLTGTISPISEGGAADPEYFTLLVVAQSIKDVGGANGDSITIKQRFDDKSIATIDTKLGTFDYAVKSDQSGQEYAYADKITAEYKIKLLIKRDLASGKSQVADSESVPTNPNDNNVDDDGGDADDNGGGDVADDLDGNDDPSGDIDTTPDFDIVNDIIVAKEQVNISIELIGMAYDYGYNDPIPVCAWWSVDGGNSLNAIGDGNLNPQGGYHGETVWDLGVFDAGTEVTLRMQNQDKLYRDRNTWTDSEYIKAKRNGDEVPEISAAFPWQDTLKDFLGDVIDPDTSLLNLPPSDVLIAAEISTLTGSGADWNDAIFVIHVDTI